MSEEQKPCPFCGSVEIGWTMLAGHKYAASYCQTCNARGPTVPFEMKREPIDETVAAANGAWAKRSVQPDEFRNALRVFIESHQSPEPYVSYEMDMPVSDDRRDEQFAIDVALLDKTYALTVPPPMNGPTTPIVEEEACPDCGGFGEYFGHADDCDSDSCALNGDIDSCNGQVFACHCSPHLREAATSTAPLQVPGPISNERGDE